MIYKNHAKKSYVAPSLLLKAGLQLHSPPSWEKDHAVSWGLGQEHEVPWAEEPRSVPRDLLVSTQEITSKGLAWEGSSPFR